MRPRRGRAKDDTNSIAVAEDEMSFLRQSSPNGVPRAYRRRPVRQRVVSALGLVSSVWISFKSAPSKRRPGQSYRR